MYCVAKSAALLTCRGKFSETLYRLVWVPSCEVVPSQDQRLGNVRKVTVCSLEPMTGGIGNQNKLRAPSLLKSIVESQLACRLRPNGLGQNSVLPLLSWF